MQKALVIRVDGSAQIGTGHVMRCLALAQAWQEVGGQATFVMAMKAAALEDRLKSEGMEVVCLSLQSGGPDDAIHTIGLARAIGASWVVVDGYHFGADYQHIIKDSGQHLLCIDDNGHAEHYYADIVLNQNVHANEALYANREPHTRLLLRTDYVLLRREFLKWRGWRREIPAVAHKVLVTFGGSDFDNVTLKAIRALHQMAADGLEAVVVVGGSNPYYEELQSAVHRSPLAIRLERDVTNMPELMAWADVVLSAGGSTCWELAFMGLPNLVLILADNQRPIAEQLDAAGVAVNLGWHWTLSSAEIAQALTELLMATGVRAEMARCGRELVDGEGTARVLDHLTSEPLRLRQVSEEDCKLLWEWANDPDVRVVSFSSEPIPWERHVKWFRSKLYDPHCVFYIATNSDDIPIGQIRYDVEDNKAIVSVSIDRKYRIKGYGSRLIGLASRKLFDISDIAAIHAYVKPGNEASIGAFVKAGFSKVGTTVFRGHRVIHLVLAKDELI